MRAGEYGAVAADRHYGTAWRNWAARTADAGNSACSAASVTHAAASCADTSAAGANTACDDSDAASARNRAATAASFTASAGDRRDDAVEWGSR
jgi:hypothetical protein